MLRFLYTAKLQPILESDPFKSMLLAIYVQVETLLSAALDTLQKKVERLINVNRWRSYYKMAVQCLSEYSGTEAERTLVQVTARNAQNVIHESGVWEDIVEAHPTFANVVLETVVPKPPETALVPHAASDNAHRPSPEPTMSTVFVPYRI